MTDEVVTGKPKAGDRVIVDANVLADWLIYGSAPAASVATRRHSLDLLLGAYCVLVWSKKLWDEAISATHRRGRVSRAVVVDRWRVLERTKQLIKVAAQQCEQATIRAAIARKVPAEDLHLMKLACAGRARLLVTDDGGLLAAGEHPEVAELVEIVNSRWVCDEMASPP
jgi:predicted nucleic acid-binding protein